MDHMMGMATTVTAALLLSLAAGPCPARGGSAVAAATRHRLDSVRSRHLAPVTVPTAVTYSLPVALSLRVLRGFDSTTTHYGAGHRGLDLQVSPDLRVLAAADGVVSFAGSVAGRGVLVLRHRDGIRTEYEPVRLLVGAGAHVSRGSPVALLAGLHRGCRQELCLHWGARRGENYLDPLTLLAPLGPVRLLPWHEG